MSLDSSLADAFSSSPTLFVTIALSAALASLLINFISDGSLHAAFTYWRLSRKARRRAEARSNETPKRHQGPNVGGAHAAVESVELADIEARLTAIESRLPSKGTIDKLESVNDAVLATQIEHLSKQLDRIESNAMTPGKVTSLLLALLATLSGILAICTWVLGEVTPG